MITEAQAIEILKMFDRRVSYEEKEARLYQRALDFLLQAFHTAPAETAHPNEVTKVDP